MKAYKGSGGDLHIPSVLASFSCEVAHYGDAWGSGVIDPSILNLGATWMWLTVSRPGRFVPEEKTLALI
jgi:hypothetical protein